VIEMGKPKFVLIRTTAIGETVTTHAKKRRADSIAKKWLDYRAGIEGGSLLMQSKARVMPIGKFNKMRLREWKKARGIL